MAKQNHITIPKQVTSKIPYIKVFEVDGLFESAPGTYSMAYFINSVESENLKAYSNADLMNKFARLLNSLPSSMTIQFLIHNKLIPQEEFLQKILVKPNKEPELNRWIKSYNTTVRENSDIGHNNVKKDKYFVLSVKADTPEEARNMFRAAHPSLVSLFSDIYGIEIEALSTIERLKIIHSMLNPERNDFGSRFNINENQLTLPLLYKKKLTTKDLVSPIKLDTTAKNYLLINSSTYARAFFITSMPAQISSNLISDITNISSNMIFSAIYEPVDTVYGYNTATEKVASNTIIKQSAKRDTIKDRRNRAQITTESMIEASETAYFNRCALKTFKGALESDNKTLMCSYIIIIYSDDYDSLERDTKLLHISTSKFATQVKPLDLQQLEGLQSALPLGVARLDVRRLFSVSKLATIPPLNIQEVLQKDGQFNGLNTINDNLVLLNRKNNVALSGIISGSEHSGKTFQCKREIFNALISTNDKVVIVSETNDYDNFVMQLHGCIVESCSLNPFSLSNHYGMMNSDRYSKTLMLEALLEVITRPKDKNVSIFDDARKNLDAFEKYDQIAAEIAKMYEVIDRKNVNLQDINAVLSCLERDPESFPTFIAAKDRLRAFLSSDMKVYGRSRLQLIKVHSLAEKIVVLDYLFNKGIKDKQNGYSSWIFVDAIDDLMSSEQCSNFIMDYIEKMDALKNIFTCVLQSAVKLFTDNATRFRTADLVNTVGYHKLLNQGAIERKQFAEILNISNSLINYITSAELGKGIILTSSSNIAFDDSFYSREEMNNSFYKLFLI